MYGRRKGRRNISKESKGSAKETQIASKTASEDISGPAVVVQTLGPMENMEGLNIIEGNIVIQTEEEKTDINDESSKEEELDDEEEEGETQNTENRPVLLVEKLNILIQEEEKVMEDLFQQRTVLILSKGDEKQLEELNQLIGIQKQRVEALQEHREFLKLKTTQVEKMKLTSILQAEGKEKLEKSEDSKIMAEKTMKWSTPANLPYFRGKKGMEDPLEFVEQFERVCLFNGIPIDRFVLLLEQCLDTVDVQWITLDKRNSVKSPEDWTCF